MTVEQVKSDARQDMAISKLVEEAIAAKVAVKAEEVQTFYKQNPQSFQQGESACARATS